MQKQKLITSTSNTLFYFMSFGCVIFGTYMHRIPPTISRPSHTHITPHPNTNIYAPSKNDVLRFIYLKASILVVFILLHLFFNSPLHSILYCDSFLFFFTFSFDHPSIHRFVDHRTFYTPKTKKHYYMSRMLHLSIACSEL